MDIVDAIHELEKVMAREPHGKRASALEEGEEVGARAVLEDDVGDVLTRLAEPGGSWALLIVHAIHLSF